MKEIAHYPYRFTMDEHVKSLAGSYYEFELWGRFICFYKETKHGSSYETKTAKSIEEKMKQIDTRGFAMVDYTETGNI